MSKEDLMPLQDSLRRMLENELREKEAIKMRLHRQGLWLRIISFIGFFLLASLMFNVMYTTVSIRETLRNRTYADTLRNEIRINREWTQRLYYRSEVITQKLDSSLRLEPLKTLRP